MIFIPRSWLAVVLCLSLPAQVKNASDLQKSLDKLQVVGSVLYIAAHPDDENTAVLATFSRGRNFRTGYLALTRGGGGQDLIGPELDDALAAIRTQELLAARRIDGAEQFFTRAVDFGYSKTPEETLSIWGREAVLADVVWTLRNFRPDVIVTRFSPAGEGTHGHHTASAMLALEAFRAAADPKRFPEQLRLVKPWQATRILWNSWRSQAERDAMAPGSYLGLDVGRFDPLLGQSYLELAAESRSQHRSQGFGAVPQRGARMEYFELLAGAPARTDLFEGIDTGWGRIPGGEQAAALLAQARRSFQPSGPTAILPILLEAKGIMDQLPADPWLELKRQELVEVIRAAAGIWVEALAERQTVVPGGTLSLTASALVRSDFPVTLVRVGGTGLETRSKQVALPDNRPVREAFTITLPRDTEPSQPYWLREPRRGGLHASPSQERTGLPENPPVLAATFTFRAQTVSFDLSAPVQFRFRDPVQGERTQPVTVIPAVMVNLSDRVHLFPDVQGREVSLNLVAGRAKAAGRLRFRAPDGWTVEPMEIPFALDQPFDEKKVTVRLTPSGTAGSGLLQVEVGTDGAWSAARQRVRIDYPHIPLQTLFPLAQASLVRLDLKRSGGRIGYVMGAGDDLPTCLRSLGYEVDLLGDEALEQADLSAYDAIVLGIRAFNTRPRLARLNARLLDYVARGGTEIVQYNVNDAFPGTNAELATQSLGPFPFHIGRDRVTEEAAAVTVLDPRHPVLNFPNRIGPADFSNWVQERGLYFAKTWDPRYQAVLAMNDAGEKPLSGSLLVGQHGKGHFVYTGLAFFRQLPEGVPGAYRLFANLLALGRE